MLEKFTPRERVVLQAGAAAVVAILLLHFGLLPWWEGAPVRRQSLEEKELTLQRYQRLTATVGQERDRLATAEQRLRDLEAGLLESGSASLANAEWQRLVRELADSKGIQLASSEVVRQQNLQPDYALVVGRVRFTCQLDQLVNLLAALGTSPKLLSLQRMRILALTGAVRNRLSVELTIGAMMRSVRSAAAQP